MSNQPLQPLNRKPKTKFSEPASALIKSLGVICVASTTERLVKMMSDGKKISDFKFVQFREY